MRNHVKRDREISTLARIIADIKENENLKKIVREKLIPDTLTN